MPYEKIFVLPYCCSLELQLTICTFYFSIPTCMNPVSLLVLVSAWLLIIVVVVQYNECISLTVSIFPLG